MTPSTQALKERNDKLDFTEMKHVFSAKDAVKRRKGQAIHGKKIFASHENSSGLEFLFWIAFWNSDYIKNSQSLNIRTTNNSIIQNGKKLTRHVTRNMDKVRKPHN